MCIFFLNLFIIFTCYSVLDGKEPDGTSKRTYASVVSGEPSGKYAGDNERQVAWRDLP